MAVSQGVPVGRPVFQYVFQLVFHSYRLFCKCVPVFQYFLRVRTERISASVLLFCGSLIKTLEHTGTLEHRTKAVPIPAPLPAPMNERS
jgi:hypothetical protein